MPWTIEHKSFCCETSYFETKSFRSVQMMFEENSDMGPTLTGLKPPDFFLWRYLKDNVFTHRLQTIPELKKAITEKIRQIQVPECVRVIDNFTRRISFCRGGHLEHVFRISICVVEIIAFDYFISSYINSNIILKL